jgi:NADH-quinone oxidoreductase subunit B
MVTANEPTSGLDAVLGNNIIMSTVDDIVNWMRKGSVWPMTFGLACCAIEMMAVGASKFDIDRFGSGPFRATPRQADLMIVAGTVTHKMAPRVKRLYDQMPEPKYVIAMGACVLKGGPYARYGYHVVKGVDLIIPVDVYIPGCPPRPEALLQGVMMVRDLCMREKLLKRSREHIKREVYRPTLEEMRNRGHIGGNPEHFNDKWQPLPGHPLPKEKRIQLGAGAGIDTQAETIQREDG